MIINETLAITDKKASILVSSTAKNNIVSVVSGVITLANTTAALTVGDELTIEIDIDNIAKESNATANKNAIINAINNIDLSTVAKESAATANKEAIIAAINSAEPDLSSVAKETSVKDGNDTTIGMLKDQTNGLAAIKSAIPTVANIQNGLAQESTSQEILEEVKNIDIDTTELAKQGDNPNATNSAIMSLIGYTIEEIDRV